jgi:hypothetical protein
MAHMHHTRVRQAPQSRILGVITGLLLGRQCLAPHSTQATCEAGNVTCPWDYQQKPHSGSDPSCVCRVMSAPVATEHQTGYWRPSHQPTIEQWSDVRSEPCFAGSRIHVPTRYLGCLLRLEHLFSKGVTCNLDPSPDQGFKSL